MADRGDTRRQEANNTWSAARQNFPLVFVGKKCSLCINGGVSVHSPPPPLLACAPMGGGRRAAALRAADHERMMGAER